MTKNLNSLVSVIVPIYKVEDYLDECVKSILGQTYKKIEIILVDDGSPDHCPQKCDEWAKKDLRIRVVHKQNGGLSSARNAGLDVAKGEYIAFVDSDDFITPDYVEVMYNRICNDKSVGIVSGMIYRYTDVIHHLLLMYNTYMKMLVLFSQYLNCLQANDLLFDFLILHQLLFLEFVVMLHFAHYMK